MTTELNSKLIADYIELAIFHLEEGKPLPENDKADTLECLDLAMKFFRSKEKKDALLCDMWKLADKSDFVQGKHMIACMKSFMNEFEL